MLDADLATLTTPGHRASLLRQVRHAVDRARYRNVDLSQRLTAALQDVDLAARALDDAFAAYERNAGDQVDADVAVEVAKIRAHRAYGAARGYQRSAGTSDPASTVTSRRTPQNRPGPLPSPRHSSGTRCWYSLAPPAPSCLVK